MDFSWISRHRSSVSLSFGTPPWKDNSMMKVIAAAGVAAEWLAAQEKTRTRT